MTDGASYEIRHPDLLWSRFALGIHVIIQVQDAAAEMALLVPHFPQRLEARAGPGLALPHRAE